MPLPIALSHRIINRLTELRQDGTIPWLRPDSKSQVTDRVRGGTPVRVHTVVVSTQHSPGRRRTRRSATTIIKQVIEPVLPPDMAHDKIIYHINPTGNFVVGGPHGDAGRDRAGRSSSTPTAAGAATAAAPSAARTPRRSTARPPTWPATSPRTSSPPAWPTAARSSSPTPSASPSRSASTSTPRGPARSPTRQIAELVRKTFPLTPAGIIKHLDLRRPIYRKTASGGHFGRDRARVHLGEDRQGRGPPPGRRRRRRRLIEPGRRDRLDRGPIGDRPLGSRPSPIRPSTISGQSPRPGGRPCPRRRKTSPAPRSPRPSAASRPPSAGRPGGSSCWATTPTTTAAWSWPPRSTARPSSSAGRRRAARPGSARPTSARSTPSPSTRSSPGDGPEAWGRYVRGVTWAIREAYGPLGSGFEAALAGDVPIGAGLSSSASLQAAFALFLAGAGLVGRPAGPTSTTAARMDLAQTLRRSENEFVGVASGLLDQFSVLFGRADHAFVLDCRTPRPRAPARSATPPRRSSSATRRPRGGWPTGCTTAAGPSASGSSAYFQARTARRAGPAASRRDARRASDELGRPRPGRPAPGPPRPDRERPGRAEGPRPSGRATSPASAP